MVTNAPRVSWEHPRDISAHSATRCGLQPQRRDQAAAGEHLDGPGVLTVEGDGHIGGIGDAEQDADHAVLARGSGHLAGIAIDDGALHASDATAGV